MGGPGSGPRKGGGKNASNQRTKVRSGVRIKDPTSKNASNQRAKRRMGFQVPHTK